MVNQNSTSMDRNTSLNYTTPSASNGSYMLFSYWNIILIFLGLTCNLFMLIVFNKVPLKRRKATPWYLSLGSSALVSTVSYIISYAKTVENNKENELVLCKLAVSLEVIGYATYSIVIMTAVCQSAIKLFLLKKEQSDNPVQLPMKYFMVTRVVIIGIWLVAIVIGMVPVWVLVKYMAMSGVRTSCLLDWMDILAGAVTWYQLVLFLCIIYTPWLVSLIALLVTHR